MRRLTIAWLALTAVAGAVRAQSAPPLDFAVPDAPAFMLLEVEAGNILRPTTTRDFAISLSDFIGSGAALVVPETFAAEFAPFLLMRGDRLTLEEYRKAPWQYRLRVSAATSRAGAGTPTQLALGLRATVLDGADLRTHPQAEALQQMAAALTRQLLDADNAVRARIAEEKRFDTSQATQERLDSLREAREYGRDVSDSAVRERLLRIPRFRPDAIPDAMVEAERTADQRLREEEAHDALREFVREFQEEHWNATVLDVAVAARAAGQDTTGRDLRLDGYAAWATYGTGIGQWGQLLLGATAGADRDTASGNFAGRFALSTRLYLGSNHYKLLVEGRADLADGRPPQWFLVSGGEARLPFGAWVTFAAGLAYDGATREAGLVTNAAVKFDLPGLAGWTP